MAINVVYDPNLDIAGQAAYSGGQGIGASQQDQFDRELMLRQQGLLEQQRQFNIDTGFRTQQAGNQDFLQRSQLAQQGQQFNVQTRQRDLAMLNDYLQNQQQAELQAQQQQLYAENLAQQAQAQKEATARSLYGQYGGLAKQQNQQQFELAQSQQKAILEARQKGLITQEQYSAAIPQWEEQFQMPWGFPGQLAAEHEQTQEQAQVQAFIDSAPRNPVTGEPLISAEAFRATGGDPKLINALYTKAMSESTRLFSEQNDMKGQAEIEKKNHEMALKAAAQTNDIAADNAFNQQKLQHEALMAKQKLWSSQRSAFLKDTNEWIAAKSAAVTVTGDDGKPVEVGAQPQWSQYDPDVIFGGSTSTPQAGTGGTPRINTKAEYDALPSGATYIDAETGRTGRKP